MCNCQRVIQVTSFIFPAACIAIGVLYWGQCPLEHRLPLYLVVSAVRGAVGVVTLLLDMGVGCFRKCKDDQGKDPKWVPVVRFAVGAGLLIAGSLFVFPNAKAFFHGWHQGYELTDGNYCQPALFLFSLCMVALGWLSWALSLVVCCCCACFACCLCCAADDEPEPHYV